METVLEETEVIEDGVLSGEEAILDLVRNTQPEIITPGDYLRDDSTQAILQKSNPGKMSADFTIVTRQQRANLHNNKVLIAPTEKFQGLKTDFHKRAPVVLFGHGALPFPIGLSEEDGQYTVKLSEKEGTARVVFAQSNPQAAVIFGMVDEGILRMSSIGFMPEKVRKLSSEEQRVQQSRDGDGEVMTVPQGGGLDILESLLLEWSVVESGADQGAIKQMLDRGHICGQKITPCLKPLFQKMAGPKTAWSPGWTPDPVNPSGTSTLRDRIQTTKQETSPGSDSAETNGEFQIERQRFENKITQSMDVEQEHLEASKLEYEWVSRYVECQVKQLKNISTFVPALYMGSFLTGLERALEGFIEQDVRQLTRDGKEMPPTYELVQLNSTISNDFLVDGLRFMKEKVVEAPKRLVVKCDRYYHGLFLNIYIPKDHTDDALEVLGAAWKWCQENNFLKGEAFTLSGKFLPRTEEQFEDVFLKTENKTPMKAAVSDLNSKGSSARKRGMILMGPPGTGKTLSGRIIKNTSKATFIWMAARDLRNFGVNHALCFAFDLSRELSPCVLFIEDIDSSLRDTQIDLIKTEMDGIEQSTGTLTILTTNYPERLSQAIIDRPGRFDDILKFDLPNAVIRKEMLEAWLGDGIDEELLEQVIERTEGYSGAHLRHLVFYAKEVMDELVSQEVEMEESEKIALAILKALDKLEKQKELIEETHLSRSQYDFKFGLQDVEFKTENTTAEQAETQSEEIKPDVLKTIGQRLAQELAPKPKKQVPKITKVDAPNVAAAVSASVGNLLEQREEALEERLEQKLNQLISEKSGVIG